MGNITDAKDILRVILFIICVLRLLITLLSCFKVVVRGQSNREYLAESSRILHHSPRGSNND